MQLKATKTIAKEKFKDFFHDKVELPDFKEQKKHGYFLQDGSEILAFFSLFPVDKSKYWLRAFVMKTNAPITLPISIIQSAQKLTAHFGGDELYILSTSSALDDLLQQLDFEKTYPLLIHEKKGNWWINKVLVVDK